ncbi:MAG: hypothetical protein OHK0015_03930 [Chloroflexi bacterium OHK40]
MTYIFINAASLNGQARDFHQAGQLLTTMMETYEHLVGICAGRHSLYRDEPVEAKQLIDGKTFREVVNFRYKQIEDEQARRATEQGDATTERDRFRRFVNQIARWPFAGDVFAAEQFECLLGDEDVRYRAIGYTAHFTCTIYEGTAGTAVLLSMSDCRGYDATHINVDYASGHTVETRRVWNVFTPQHITSRRRWYDHNYKHPPEGDLTDFVAAMDLNADKAQFVLDSAVELEGERRVFARYQQRIYIFPCHVQRNDDQPGSRSLYHGFLVGDPRKMRSRMGDICAKLFKHFQWEELAP